MVKLASADVGPQVGVEGRPPQSQDRRCGAQASGEMKETLEAAGQADEMLGVTVQPMAGEGTEVMIGMTEDPSFGPLVAFGLGGVTVELLGDVVFRITPLTDRDAWNMVKGIRGFKLLDGYRNCPCGIKRRLRKCSSG